MLGLLVFTIIPLWLMACVFIVPWSIVRIFGHLKVKNYSLLIMLSSLYGGLTFIKLFSAVVNDLGRGGNNLVLKIFPTVFNYLAQIPSDETMPNGLGTGLYVVGNWYAKGHYIHLATLNEIQIDVYHVIIGLWWIITVVVFPIWSFTLLKRR
ncbi:MAG TPA: hypothetical protein DEF42_15140 [Desulfosporosinus sp.]|nr:hypothetical protein [Desulfosporosinus sp.]